MANHHANRLKTVFAMPTAATLPVPEFSALTCSHPRDAIRFINNRMSCSRCSISDPLVITQFRMPVPAMLNGVANAGTCSHPRIVFPTATLPFCDVCKMRSVVFNQQRPPRQVVSAAGLSDETLRSAAHTIYALDAGLRKHDELCATVGGSKHQGSYWKLESEVFDCLTDGCKGALLAVILRRDTGDLIIRAMSRLVVEGFEDDLVTLDAHYTTVFPVLTLGYHWLIHLRRSDRKPILLILSIVCAATMICLPLDTSHRG